MSHGTHSHASHDHQHTSGCGHTAVQHGDHVDFLHEGHLHGKNGQECSIETNTANPAQCTPQHACGDHAKDHQHGAGCGHEAVPHGDHVDYMVEGHLHHPHGTHCDDHGALRVVR